jgi:hypothetical protein
MTCEKLDSCVFLDELYSQVPLAGSMVMATLCHDNKFSCEGYKRSRTTMGDVPQYFQWPNNKMDVMEHIFEGMKELR